MKKLIATLIVVVLAISVVIGLVACDVKYPEEVKKALEAAATMTDAELAAASAKEFEDNPNAFFNVDSLTSGIKKALDGFGKKYEWIHYATKKVPVVDKDGNPVWTLNKDEYGIEIEGSYKLDENGNKIQKEEEVTDTSKANVSYNSKKGSEYQPKLTAASKSASYIADFVMIQDAAFVNSLAKKGFLLSHVPTGTGYNIADSDKTPLVGVTFNKIFMQNSTSENFNQLKNVWQLTGQDSADGTLKKIEYFSYQSPLGEDINMNFLIMLTSPDACTKLASAYESYFGHPYVANKDYKNIGYEFVALLCKNMKHHKSDTTEVKLINDAAHRDSRVIFAGLCKLKDYVGYKVAADQPGYYKTTVSAAGWNNDVEGFPGFVYNMWTLIPATTKLPYTACLFARYILSEEGYRASGWNGVLGYYSANQLISSVEGDPALSVWKEKAIVEDVDYVTDNYKKVSAFIKKQLA